MDREVGMGRVRSGGRPPRLHYISGPHRWRNSCFPQLGVPTIIITTTTTIEKLPVSNCMQPLPTHTHIQNVRPPLAIGHCLHLFFGRIGPLIYVWRLDIYVRFPSLSFYFSLFSAITASKSTSGRHCGRSMPEFYTQFVRKCTGFFFCVLPFEHRNWISMKNSFFFINLFWLFFPFSCFFFNILGGRDWLLYYFFHRAWWNEFSSLVERTQNHTWSACVCVGFLPIDPYTSWFICLGNVSNWI